MHVIALIQTEGEDTRGLPHWLFHSSVPWENNPILGKTSRAAGSKAAWLHAVSGVMERPSSEDSYFTLKSIQMFKIIPGSLHTYVDRPRVQNTPPTLFLTKGKYKLHT